VNIKHATSDDIKFIQELHILVGPPNLGEDKDWTYEELMDMFHDNLCFIAWEDNTRIGFILGTRLRPFGAMIWNAAVLPKYQSRMVGPQLIKHFEDSALASGVKWIVNYIKHNADWVEIERNGRKYLKGEKYTEVITIL